MAKFTLSLCRYIFDSLFYISELQVPCVLNREFYDFICDPFEIFVITQKQFTPNVSTVAYSAQVLCGARLPRHRAVRGDDQLTIR